MKSNNTATQSSLNPFHMVQQYMKSHYSPRDETLLEQAVEENWNDAKHLRKKLASKECESLTYFPALDGAIFCGHLVADCDSVSGAVGAAHLYGGIPARASDLNSETKFALEYWDCPVPVRVEDLLQEQPDANVCLVDFQQQSQLNQNIPLNNICAVIDHHALQNNTIITEKPIFVDIRPWGSVSTIIAQSYALQEKYLPRYIAGMLLSAILSDTLNLRSPTTTAWDERMVAMLVQHVDMDDVNMFAAKQFRAKSHELSLMSPYSLVNGDMKRFKFNSTKDESIVYTIGYSVIETVDAEASLVRAQDIILEMQNVRNEQDLTAMLLAIVDIVNLSSHLLLCGPVENSLALESYGGKPSVDGKTLELPGLVSRKKDFIPPLTQAVNKGWSPPSTRKVGRRSSHIVMDYSQVANGTLLRVFDDDGIEAAA